MLLIARYDCFVAGKPTQSVDYQVKHYDVAYGEDLEALLEGEATQHYLNENDERVEWKFSEIVSVEWDPTFKHGEEVIGFITGSPSTDL